MKKQKGITLIALVITIIIMLILVAVTVRYEIQSGLSVANWLGLKFIQEVMAETEAIKKYHPETDVIIELGSQQNTGQKNGESPGRGHQ